MKMKLATAFLADAANVREGLLNVLSGFVNQIQRPEYPAALGVALVIVVEIEPMGEDVNSLIQLSFELHRDLDGAEIAASEAELEIKGDMLRRAFIPITLPLHDLEIPETGTYSLTVRAGDEEVGFELYADLVD